MTSRSPCLVLAMLCYLLAAATSASAECAWVLWSQERETARNRPWQPIDASANEGACRRKMKEQIEKARRLFNDVASNFVAGEDFYAATVPNASGEGTTRGIMTLRCLPDTVDPRERPGK